MHIYIYVSFSGKKHRLPLTPLAKPIIFIHFPYELSTMTGGLIHHFQIDSLYLSPILQKYNIHVLWLPSGN